MNGRGLLADLLAALALAAPGMFFILIVFTLPR